MQYYVFRLSTILSIILPILACQGQENKVPAAKSKANQGLVDYRRVVDGGVEYLRVRGQAADGSFSKQNGLGVSALVTASLLAANVSREDPMVAKALKYLH